MSGSVSVVSRRHGRLACLAVATVAAMVAAVGIGSPPAAAATSNPAPVAGARKHATRLSFPISGTTGLSVDVGSKNMLITDQLLTLPGIRSNPAITLWYNSSTQGSSVPSAVTGGTGSGWGITGFDERVVTNPDGSVTFYGPGGLAGVFTSNGAGGFTAPPQFQADLTGSASAGYTLIDHASQETLSFNASGRLTSDADRDGNATTYAYTAGGYPASITTSRWGGTGATVAVTESGSRITTLTETNGSLSRQVSLGYSAKGHLASVTDTMGGVTHFASGPGTDTGQVLSVTSPQGKATTLGLDSIGRINSVAQANPDGAGTSTTRLYYQSTTQTLVADPTTNQSQPVASVPHTSYTLTADDRVSSATDPDGHHRAATYNAVDNVLSVTPAAGGTTSLGYTNAGESLNQIASPQGATDSVQYSACGQGNGPGCAYLPSSSTDDSGNALAYTYDGNGNQLGTQQGATGPSATVTYHSNGTPATSASPGAPAGVVTSYGYDGTGDLTSITPPAGTSLGNRAYTWDGFGRLSTATDGAGDTISYTYDDLDRITRVHYSDGTPDVAYTYDASGRITKRVDGSGTTTYTYDDLGNLLSTTNSANRLTSSYTYDLAGAQATATDGAGTVTYGYDAAHQLTSMTYPQSGTTLTTVFANDANGRRTDVWLQSNTSHTAWSAHEHYTYDATGRITGVTGQNGPAASPTTVLNETVCYAANSTAPSCSTAPANDRSNIQWVSNAVSGETSSYHYDTSGRLTGDTITGGTDPRTYTYGYDQAGNRTSSTVTGSSPSSQALTFNAGNQITSSGYGYDGAGDQTSNPTRTAAFNAAGQKTSTTTSKGTSTYAYAGTNQNELLSQTVPGASTYTYAYGRPSATGVPQIDTVKVGTGTGYVFHDPSGLPIMLQTNSSVTCLYMLDPMSNPVLLSTSFHTTSLAIRYDPYGGATRTDGGGANGASTENPYLFGLGLQDRSTGELKFGQRWYNPLTGTWTQQDTLNAPLDPANANRYEYAADNPLNILDSTGLFNWGAVLGGAAVVIGADVIETAAIGISLAVAPEAVPVELGALQPVVNSANAFGVGLIGYGASS
ncbi:RHS repeat-associated core domain-containing protein [Leekyejoonella antrihumi]|uniref:Teneurin-like YD-shell domain-containing protein n=1 Tax=Leekyejoonella antrihumi TaxID=1660198 RepID=A0A563EA26_9MICO|nr:RHS repeat-associated core domain-containing protein [Leekyejoonella antrihumi]TWP39063.1 hypothetical protein FGL98_01365 [Leekyejoonella antrihumi]